MFEGSVDDDVLCSRGIGHLLDQHFVRPSSMEPAAIENLAYTFGIEFHSASFAIEFLLSGSPQAHRLLYSLGGRLTYIKKN